MSDILNTIENVSTLSLCYLDEIDESLKEVDESTYFAVSAKNITYKRLYLIGDLIYKGTLKVTAYLPSDFDDDYLVRLRLGEQYTSIDDFQNTTNSVSGNYNILGYKFGNAIPLDVLVISNAITENHTNINFVLEWDDSSNNCNNPNFLRQQQTISDVGLAAPTTITVKINNEQVYSTAYDGDTSASSVLNYLRSNTFLGSMGMSTNVADRTITCTWVYKECLTIMDDRGRLLIELKGTEDIPA